ncbi:hypothetical protein ACOMHN_027509 [Nucella lapillus]
MLKQKYTKLRKKKKQLQSLKTTKPEVQPKPFDQISKKAPESAGEATEQAKKLVQSGAIKVGSGSKEKAGFKRSRHLEKKKETDKVTPDLVFTPFSSQLSGEEDDKLEPSKPKIGRLSDSFVSSSSRHDSDGRRDRDRDDRRERGRDDRRDREPPSKGQTIYVHGIGVNEDLLKKAFSSFGKILNINTERERNNGFVSFEKMDSADQAIANMNGSMISNVQLNVSMARRQPTFDHPHDSSPLNWASIAASNSQKGPSRKEDRDMVTYDADDMF